MNIHKTGVISLVLLTAACGGGENEAASAPPSEQSPAENPAATSDAPAQKEALLRASCFEKSKADACFIHAQRIELGETGAPDLEEARLSYDKACSLKHAAACVMISLVGAPEGSKSAMVIEPVDNGASGNETAAAKATRLKYFRARISENARGYKLARRLFGAACDEGSAQACLAFGHIQKSGRGGLLDEAGAASAFDRACQGGVGDACFALAQSKKSKQGSNLDDVRSLLQSACDAGHLGACTELSDPGPIAALNDTVRQTIIDCENGAVASCVDAGLFFLEREGVAPDYALGRKYLVRGCDITQSDACQNAGHAQSRGFGGPVDILGARFSFANACYGFGRAEASCFELKSD